MRYGKPFRLALAIPGFAMILSAAVTGTPFGSWSYMGATLVLLALLPVGGPAVPRGEQKPKPAPLLPAFQKPAAALLAVLLALSAAFAVWQGTSSTLVIAQDKTAVSSRSDGATIMIPDWSWTGSVEVELTGTPGAGADLWVDSGEIMHVVLTEASMTFTLEVPKPASYVYLRPDESNTVALSNIRIYSTVDWPRLLLWLCGLWGTLLALYAVYRRRLDLAALALITGVGLCYVFVKQITVPYGWDEPIHRTWTFAILGDMHKNISDYIAGARTWYLGYLPSAFGAWAARLLSLPKQWVWRMGNVASVIAYALLCMRAVHHAPRCRLTVLALAALPTCLYSAGSYTYDGVVIGCSLLFAATLAEYCERGTRLSVDETLRLIVPLTLASLTKPVYSLLLLLGFFLPEGCFRDRRERRLFRGALVFLMVWCELSLLMPGVYDNVSSGDTRIAGTDSAAQLAFITGHPLDFLAILLRYCLTGIPQCYLQVSLYHFGSYSGIPKLGLLLTAMLLLWCPLASAGEPEGRPLTAKRRVLLALISVLPMVVLAVTQYCVSSQVGSSSVDGVQNRYTLPLWLPMAWALLLPDGLRRRAARFTPAVELLTVAALGVSSMYAVYTIILPIWWL